MTDHTLPPLHVTSPGLYRHYKGGWYEVLGTVRCSETLQGMTVYRALCEQGMATGEQWVRPSSMFNASGVFAGKEQARFARWDVAQLPLRDLATARAMIMHLRHLAMDRRIALHETLRPPPPEPTACCGRGCNGCVWDSFYEALGHWRDEALGLLTAGI